MQDALKTYFPEIEDLYEYQKKAIKSLLDKRNTMAIVPTGGGKSLIYQLSGVLLPGLTIVVSPLKALMREQVEELVEKGVQALAINSDMPFQEQRNVLRKMSAENNQIIYVSPERLHNYFFRSALLNSSLNVSLVAIDEAHCISHWGFDFRPDYANIKPFVKFLRDNGHNPALLALTATLSKLPREDIIDVFEIENKLVEKSVIRDNLELNFLEVANDDEKPNEIKQFIDNNNLKKVLVYTYSRLKCEELSVDMKQSGFFHAGLSSEEKIDVYKKFKHGDIKVMFSTTAFGMGMNIPDIDGVIHYQIPESVEEYYQHVGRGARDKVLCPECKCLFLWTDKNFDFRVSQIKANILDDEDLKRGFERFNPKNKANDIVQFNYQELYANDGSYGTVNLKLLLQLFEKHDVLSVVGEINGTPHSIKFVNSTEIWDDLHAALGRRNSFILASKKINMPLQDIIQHIYQEELKGNIDKIPAEEKQLFIKLNYSELPPTIANKIISESKDVTKYKLSLLSNLKELTFTTNKEEYIAGVLDISN